MTGHDSFEANLASLFDDDAQAPIPAGQLDRLLTAVASRQPRPARLAGLGGRWIADPAPGSSPLGALRATMPVLRVSGAVLLLLLTLALIGTAALIGGRLLAPGPEKLLYELDGVIYLADADGRNPVRVAEGASGASWSPDGRHFLSFDTTRLTADIRDPDGKLVASLPGFNGWSPDSTRVQAWTRSQRQINIYGIDGALQAELPLPDGYTQFRENLGVWAPDGRSIWVLIAVGGSDGRGEREVWALPIDASAPRRVAQGSAVIPFPPSFTPDGTRMAFTDWKDGSATIYVANADGTESREIDAGWRPTWSPNGEQLAYQGGVSDLKVVDVATGIERTLISGWSYGTWPLHSWSRDGDRILYSKQDGSATGSLWTVGAEGGEPMLLVEGATNGAWQPTPPTAPAVLAPTPAPAPTPALTPMPTGAPSSTPAKPVAVRRLVYELGGVIYLADADGSDPTRVGDGHLRQTIETGSVWSPEGRHFLYYQDDGMGHISDADGTLVSSTEGMWGYWSPDSTRLQAWTSETGIAVHGIDGVLQATLALPAGHGRLYETAGVWAPDGRSVLVRTQQSGVKAMWQLPIDGSAPRRLADDHPFARGYGAFSPDGRLVAYVLQDFTQGASTDLVVANADGSDARTVATGNDSLSSFMAWSPDSKRLASYAHRGAQIDLVVLEVAAGTVLTAVADFSRDGYPPFSWSSASDRLLFAAPGDGGETSLWSVNVDGTGRTLLVQGATWGAMPPANATDSSDDPPGEGDDATPSPASTPSDARVRPGASLIRLAGNDVSVVLPDGLAGRLPVDGDAGNGIRWGGNDDESGRTGARWTTWSIYAPGDIDDPSRNDDSFLPLPSDPVAWLRQRPGLTVLAERDIEVGGQPARLLDVVRPEEAGSFLYEMPVGDSGSTRAFMVAGGTHSRLVIWQLGHTWMVAQANAYDLSALETPDAPGDLFMQFIADLRFP